jgi:hypothetical protein
MVAAMVEVRKARKSRDGREPQDFRDERKGKQECERCHARAAYNAFSHDGRMGFLASSVYSAAFVELGEDGLPFAAGCFLLRIERAEMVGGRLHGAPRFEFRRAQFFEAPPRPPPAATGSWNASQWTKRTPSTGIAPNLRSQYTVFTAS